MKPKLVTVVLCLSLLASILAIYINISPVAAQTTNVYIDPDPVEKNYTHYGTYFNVTVMIQNVTDLFGFDFNMTWNSTLITFSDSYYYDELDAVWGPYATNNWVDAINSTGAGWYKLVALSTSIGYTNLGAQALFKIEFYVEGPICNSMRETSIHFETHKLSDSASQPITHTPADGTYRITGKTPILDMSPTSVTFRMYNATHPYSFTIDIDLSDAENVEDFVFEIHFNTTLLDYDDVAWDAWGGGTMNVDEANGNLTGSTSGTLKNGDLTLMTITFNVTWGHIWKNLAGWVNDQSGTIYFQWANLSYPDAPDLGYVKGGLAEITVGPDVVYTFSPIQGDVLLDGLVEIWDLRTVAAYYDQVNDTYNLTGDPIVDIFDLVIIGTNFGGT